MHVLLTPFFILVLSVLLRAGDTAIGAAQSRDTIRAILYGIVAVLALLFLVITLIGSH